MYSQRKIEYYHVKQDQVRFSLSTTPARFNLASLSEEIVDWIEHHGFDFMSVCNRKGRVLYTSTSVEKVLGYQREDIIGDLSIRYIPRRSRAAFIETFLFDSPYRQRFTIQLKSITGKNVWVDVVIKTIFIEDIESVLYLILVKNISDKKEAEEMLIRSEKMSVAGQLAAGVVHEIRNPLTSLKGFIDLLQAGIDRNHEYYKIMIEEIEKIETISSELLFISKPLTHNQSYQWIKGMIEDVITLLNTQAKNFDIRINLVCPNDYVVYVDRSQMKQVFINLIKNAIEAMAAPGEITAKVERRQNLCVASVIDEGPGIPPHLIHKVKEPFFTTKKEGTGLGLMITTRIIENHNGLFKILSNKPTGTTFEVHLPYYSPSNITI
ncbi:two-component system, sporulation sensor kinase A [Amphibacillus marinus]|uniref:histidine kinase n=1 Tax=Amphibacillus marinus TaxID=872970 RepID=A0A1H8GX78_9BACI|nr:ATP-binding protein [Amphibacillus marinus]SEN48672.1 two-component system, sporulation sensor kinase A [Amphibacillus marinus]